MKHERLKILELLENGKIPAEEATKLLEAMKGDPRSHHVFSDFSFDDDVTDHMEDKLNRFSRGVDNFARDFGNRMETFYKDVEPRLKKASQTVLEKTAAVFDEISKSLNESLENARACECEDEECCQESCCDEEPCCEPCCEEPADNEPREN